MNRYLVRIYAKSGRVLIQWTYDDSEAMQGAVMHAKLTGRPYTVSLV